MPSAASAARRAKAAELLASLRDPKSKHDFLLFMRITAHLLEMGARFMPLRLPSPRAVYALVRLFVHSDIPPYLPQDEEDFCRRHGAWAYRRFCRRRRDVCPPSPARLSPPPAPSPALPNHANDVADFADVHAATRCRRVPGSADSSGSLRGWGNASAHGSV